MESKVVRIPARNVVIWTSISRNFIYLDYSSRHMDLHTTIKKKLETALKGAKVELLDHSRDHAGHAASGAHLEVHVTFKGFEGKTPVECHRMVYDVLEEEMKGPIHALIIKTKVA